MESLCIRLEIGLELFTIGVVYRRPSSDFEQYLLEYIDLVRGVGCENCFMYRDFNLDLLRYENSELVQSIVNSNFENLFT